MTVPVREQGNRSRKIVGERRGGGEGVGVTMEVMNGEGFRAGDGRGKMVYCEGSQLYIRKKAVLPSQTHASHYQYEVLLYMSLTVQQNSDKLSLIQTCYHFAKCQHLKTLHLSTSPRTRK